MPYYLAEIRFNKSRRKEKKKKRLILSLVSLTLISLLISTPMLLFSAVTTASKPSLPSILNELGFTNITLTEEELFPSGKYNITLFAEFICSHDYNELSYYSVGSIDFQTIFTGFEGTTSPSGGYVDPPLSKIINVDSHFGFSLLIPESCRYFTEHSRNSDSKQHSMVYRNLDVPGMFLIGFEHVLGEGDVDYDDMIFSIAPIIPARSLEIINVTRSPQTPNYDQSVKVAAQVISEISDVESVILGYKINAGNFINVTMNLEDGLYIATLPAQSYNSIVNYEVYASDTAGNYAVSAKFSYVVGDFVSPVISDVTYVPSLPYSYDVVKVSTRVVESDGASGVKNVILWYTETGTWKYTEMTLRKSVWISNIPRQENGVYVEFFVEALDNAGNTAETDIFGYTVIIIPNFAPIAEFSELASVIYTGEVIDLDASASYDSDGYIVSYSWDFGDGITGLGVTVSHSYVDDGEYVVILRVVDDDGAVGSKIKFITVKNRPPLADLSTSSTILYKEEAVTFDASESYDPDGSIVIYSWDFGDGNTDSGVTVNHSYASSGTYTVTLTVKDDDGATGSASVIETVRNKSPVAVFTESAHTLNTGDVINFDASESYDPDGTIVSYFWDFGDGTNASGVMASHAYADNGSYVVTLTVTDDGEVANSVNSTKTVRNRPPVVSFTESDHTVYSGESIHFDASESYDPDGSIVIYSWDFGDGNTENGVEVNHAYQDDGVYTVTLTVVDNDGATVSVTATKSGLNRPPIAIFTENTTMVRPDDVIRFDASESYDPDGTIVSYFWDFGDGTTATSIMTDHIYHEEGDKKVILTVTDDDGATGSFDITMSVKAKTRIEATFSLAILSMIGFGIAALTATLLYGLYVRRKRKKKKGA
jgi:PKD repeat protein